MDDIGWFRGRERLVTRDSRLERRSTETNHLLDRGATAIHLIGWEDPAITRKPRLNPVAR